MFIRSKRECTNCGTVYWSDFPGDFVPCSCFANREGNKGGAVDSTLYCERLIGSGVNVGSVMTFNMGEYTQGNAHVRVYVNEEEGKVIVLTTTKNGT